MLDLFGGSRENGLGLPDDFTLDLGTETLDSRDAGQSDIIALQGEDLRRFQFRFRNALHNAKSQMHEIHEDAKNDRKVYRTIPRVPVYPGGPDVTTPLSADYADGFLAHLKDAIEQRPLVSFTPEGTGRQAEEATEIAPILEAYFERILNATGARRIIASDIPQECSVVGTGIVKFSLVSLNGEIFPVPSRLIRLENFFVDRIAVDNLRDTFCAYRYKERFYNLEEQAEEGLLDPAAVAKLRSYSATDEEQIPEEDELHFDETLAFQEENTLHTIYTGYLRYKGTLYECVYHDPNDSILALRENPAREAYDAPPVELARVGRQPGYLFGRGIVRRLEPEQKIADNSINTHLALNNVAAAPPIQYNVNNPIAKKLAQNRVLEPAMWIPNYGPPDKQDIHPIQIPNPGLAMGDYQLALSMAQRRTYTDEAIGQSGSTRKTLGQFRTEVMKGTLKLRLDLGDFAYDMNNGVLKKYWAMIVAYKVIPEGLVEVEPGGKLLAASEIEYEEIAQQVVEIGGQMLLNGQLTMPDIDALQQRIDDALTNGRVPGIRRNDLTLGLTGTKIIADKIGELDTEIKLFPMLMNVLEGARVDTYFNYWGRSILRKAGFTDIEKRWPNDPGTMVNDPTLRFMLMQNLNQLVESSSISF